LAISTAIHGNGTDAAMIASEIKPLCHMPYATAARINAGIRKAISVRYFRTRWRCCTSYEGAAAVMSTGLPSSSKPSSVPRFISLLFHTSATPAKPIPAQYKPMDTQTIERTDTDERVDDGTDSDTPKYFHYVKKDKIAESAVMGTHVVALCGEVFPVTKAAKPGSPVCPDCKRIYEKLKS
jgi:Protein of unknown function (DUF3039)